MLSVEFHELRAVTFVMDRTAALIYVETLTLHQYRCGKFANPANIPYVRVEHFAGPSAVISLDLPADMEHFDKRRCMNDLRSHGSCFVDDATIIGKSALASELGSELLSANLMRSVKTDARSTRLPATSPAHAVMGSGCARGLREHVSNTFLSDLPWILMRDAAKMVARTCFTAVCLHLVKGMEF